MQIGSTRFAGPWVRSLTALLLFSSVGSLRAAPPPNPVEGAVVHFNVQRQPWITVDTSGDPPPDPDSAMFGALNGSDRLFAIRRRPGKRFEFQLVPELRFGRFFDFIPIAGAWNGKDYVFAGNRLLFHSGTDGSTRDIVQDAWTKGLTSVSFVSPSKVVAGSVNGTGSDPAGFYLVDLSQNTSSYITGPGVPASSAWGFGDGGAAVFTPHPPGTDPVSVVLFGFAFTGIARSTDAGLTLTSVPGLPSFLRVYRFEQGLPGGPIVAATSQGIYRTTNLGQSFTKVTAGLPSGSTLFPDVCIGPDGTTLYAPANVPSPTVYKSVDQGASWTATGPGITASAINSVASTDTALLAGTSNGVFGSTDSGATWQATDGPDFSSILRILPVGNTLFAGTFGNASGVIRSDDFGESWTGIGGPAVAYKIVRALHASGNVLLAGGEGGYFRSTDSGTTFAAPDRAGIGLPPSGTPYAFTPVASGVLLGISPGGVWKSGNDGASWTSSSSGLPANVNVSSLVSSGDTAYLGSNGPLYKSVNGGGSWSAVTPPNPVGPYLVYSLLVNGGDLYAGTYGFGTPDTNGLFKSTDSGSSWLRLSNGLPSNEPVYSLTADIHRVNCGFRKGLFSSEDRGATWKTFEVELANTPIFSLGVSPPAPLGIGGRRSLAAGPEGRVIVGTAANGAQALDVPRRTKRLVPIVLDVDNGIAHYTTELEIANRGASTATLTLLYTASIATGTGTASETLRPGQQLVIPDAIAYLRGKGVPIPAEASVGGTLLVTFDGVETIESVSVTARTTTATAGPQPAGAAGLAYTAIDPASAGSTGALTLFGLRSNSSDRTNVAVYNTSAQAVTLKITAFNGDGSGASSVIEAAAVLPAYGWKQFNRILEGPVYATGWVVVERTSSSGSFGAYAVINDNGTSDGSFVLPARGSTILGAYLNVPVIVETGSFVSELVLTNASAAAATFNVSYRESLAPGSGAGGSASISVPARTQLIFPGAIAELRRRGVAIGAPGGGYAGSLHVSATGALVNDLFAGARTGAPSPASGQFGLFTPAFFPGEEASDDAYVYGLRADAQNRSNVAIINTGQTVSTGSITLQVQVYDGNAGGVASGSAETVTLGPGEWKQLSGIVGAKGVANGWVKITRTGGSAPWIAYGVVNDGAGSGQRTGDGAYLPMTR
ncbi:MAG: hypothetical protein ABIT01_14325 [Thermoanaerobaculia bacterium]